MIGLLPAEIRRQVGRKGSFYGAMIWIGLFALGLLIWALASDKATAEKVVDNGTGLALFATVLAAIVVGATAGAFDVDEGTMRYLVLTGRPRWQLVLVRFPALMVTIVLLSLPALLLILLTSFITSGPAPTGTEYFDLFYVIWMSGFLYGTLSLAIGTFLKSNGVAIAVAVVLNFAGLLIAGLIQEEVSVDLGNAFFTISSSVVIAREADIGPPATFSLTTSAIVTALWLIVFVTAAYLRVQRSEY